MLLNQQPATRSPKQRSLFRKKSALPPPDFLRLADLLAPASIEEFPQALRVGERDWVQGIAVTAFPREVAPGWLAPLLMHDDILDLVMHLHPQDQAATMRQLQRRRAGYLSIQSFNSRQGRQNDPDTHVAQGDVDRTMSRLARGEERLFEVEFLMLVRAPDKQALIERSERVLARLQTVLLNAVAHPTTFEHAAAFRSGLPEGRDELRRTIALDTTSLATTFLFLSNALSMPNGTFLGITGTNEPVLLDPWHPTLENPHAFVGGVTGGGKSYLGKLWIERSLLLHGIGPQAERHSVIDPDGEFTQLAQALGGSVIHLAPGSKHHLNPFDLLPPGCNFTSYLAREKRGDRLAEKIQDLQSLLDVMLAYKGNVLDPREKALLDPALDTYSPIALELAATSQDQHFLLRSTDPVAQRHLAQQIQARYPQVRICSAPADPLALQDNEEWSLVELRPGSLFRCLCCSIRPSSPSC